MVLGSNSRSHTFKAPDELYPKTIKFSLPKETVFITSPAFICYHLLPIHICKIYEGQARHLKENEKLFKWIYKLSEISHFLANHISPVFSSFAGLSFTLEFAFYLSTFYLPVLSSCIFPSSFFFPPTHPVLPFHPSFS